MTGPEDALASVGRIGLYGGAFDPPHAAHLAVARAAIDQLALDRLLVLPTGQAWHKSRPLTPAFHRLAMARLAFAELPKAQVDDRETRRAGPSYTVETLREIAAGNPGVQLFLVIGEDQARAFQTWKEWRDILGLATVAVAPRLPGEAISVAGNADALADDASHDDKVDLFSPERWDGRAVIRLLLPALPHSATAIRTQLFAGAPAAQLAAALVPHAVARYIDQHRLYLTT